MGTCQFGQHLCRVTTARKIVIEFVAKIARLNQPERSLCCIFYDRTIFILLLLSFRSTDCGDAVVKMLHGNLWSQLTLRAELSVCATIVSRQCWYDAQ